MFEPPAPASGPDIVRALQSQHADLLRYLTELATPEFVAPQGSKWSPADHVRHLRKSTRPLVTALAVPLLLRLRFGAHRDDSRNYAQVRELYRTRLALGYGRTGFEPTTRGSPANPDVWRAEIMSGWTATVRALASRVGAWNERALDRYQVPHPLLGKMSIREILLFTLYHNAHHVQLVAERRASGQLPGTIPA